MKVIIISACLSLIATLSTLCHAQASPVQNRITRRTSLPTRAIVPIRQSTSTFKPDSRTEVIPKPQSSQVQLSPRDPRRNPPQPCPACGMG